MEDNKGFVKLYRSMLTWEWYDDINVKILFFTFDSHLPIMRTKNGVGKRKKRQRDGPKCEKT